MDNIAKPKDSFLKNLFNKFKENLATIIVAAGIFLLLLFFGIKALPSEVRDIITNLWNEIILTIKIGLTIEQIIAIVIATEILHLVLIEIGVFLNWIYRKIKKRVHNTNRQSD